MKNLDKNRAWRESPEYRAWLAALQAKHPGAKIEIKLHHANHRYAYANGEYAGHWWNNLNHGKVEAA
jgi:hypothetical protein